MKKNSIIIIFLVIATFIFNVYKVCANDQLKIDSNSLKNSNNNAYMSVLDIYGVDLFTDKVDKTKEQVKNQQEQKIQNLYNNIFLSGNDISNLKNEQFTKKVEEYKLFDKSKVEKKIKYTENIYDINIINISIIIFLCILTGVLTRIYYVYKSKGEEKNSEYNSYTGLW